MTEYIEREAALREIERRETFMVGDKYISVDSMKTFIKNRPAADVAPVVHGRWERDADGDWYCTNCDEVVAICESGRERTYRKPYCPNCGAMMDGGGTG